MDSIARKKIILVEDDNIISYSQSRFLTENGFQVTAVSTGEEAVKLVASGSLFDLVLMDIDLGGGIDGIQAASEITAVRDLPIVFLTAFSDEETLKRINGISRYGYVVKNSGNFVILSAINMAFKLTESARILRESEEKYRFIAENSTDVICKLDENGVILYLSPLNKLVSGYDDEELLGSNIVNFYHPDDRGRVIEDYKKIVSNSGIFTSVYRFRDRDGKYRWIESTSKRIMADDNRVTGIISSSRDITSRVETEKALKESEERLRLVMNGVPAMLLYIDKDKRFVYANDECSRWFSIGKDEIPGKLVRDVVPEEIYNRALTLYENAKLGEKISFEGTVADIEGAERSIRVNFVPEVIDDEVNGFFVLIFDVTDIRRAEQKILTLLNEKDLLLKEVHHRVKNNMGSIAALLYLQMDSIDNPIVVNALQDARSRVISMMGIYDILYKSGEYRQVPARAYFSDLLNKISSTYITSSRVSIENEIDEMTLDSGILFPVGMIVNELLTNAVKYAFPGGKSGVIKVRISIRDEKYIEISIRDNGIGLPDAMEISGSRGFGLTLVKMMVQQIKGSIKINRIGGTEFKINFTI